MSRGRSLHAGLVCWDHRNGTAARMSDAKKAVATQFGRMSRAYAESPGHAHGPDLDMMVELLALSRTMLVLDAATGAGHTAAAVAQKVKRVVAIDLSRQMIDRVLELATTRRINNIESVVMDVEALGFQD